MYRSGYLLSHQLTGIAVNTEHGLVGIDMESNLTILVDRYITLVAAIGLNTVDACGLRYGQRDDTSRRSTVGIGSHYVDVGLTCCLASHDESIFRLEDSSYRCILNRSCVGHLVAIHILEELGEVVLTRGLANLHSQLCSTYVLRSTVGMLYIVVDGCRTYVIRLILCSYLEGMLAS